MDRPGLLCSGTSVEACFFKTPQWHFRIVNSLLGQQGGFGSWFVHLATAVGCVLPMGGKGWFCSFFFVHSSHHWLESFPGRPTGGGNMRSTYSGVLPGDCSSPPHSQEMVSITSEDTALRAHHQGPQGQTASPTSLLSQDSSPWAPLRVASQCLAGRGYRDEHLGCRAER